MKSFALIGVTVLFAAGLVWWVLAPERQIQWIKYKLGLPPTHSESGRLLDWDHDGTHMRLVPDYKAQMAMPDSEPKGDFRGFDAEGNAIYADVE